PHCGSADRTPVRRARDQAGFSHRIARWWRTGDARRSRHVTCDAHPPDMRPRVRIGVLAGLLLSASYACGDAPNGDGTPNAPDDPNGNASGDDGAPGDPDAGADP